MNWQIQTNFTKKKQVTKAARLQDTRRKIPMLDGRGMQNFKIILSCAWYNWLKILY